LPCKITGALGFGGLGAYALKEAQVVNRMPGRAKTAVGLGVTGVGKVFYIISIHCKRILIYILVFISAGLYRLAM
jgi:hypothetical protein